MAMAARVRLFTPTCAAPRSTDPTRRRPRPAARTNASHRARPSLSPSAARRRSPCRRNSCFSPKLQLASGALWRRALTSWLKGAAIVAGAAALRTPCCTPARASNNSETHHSCSDNSSTTTNNSRRSRPPPGTLRRLASKMRVRTTPSPRCRLHRRRRAARRSSRPRKPFPAPSPRRTTAAAATAPRRRRPARIPPTRPVPVIRPDPIPVCPHPAHAPCSSQSTARRVTPASSRRSGDATATPRTTPSPSSPTRAPPTAAELLGRCGSSCLGTPPPRVDMRGPRPAVRNP
mmetsp:Transcript_37441/g.115630  ORF Transcript_37441/g.115630 Transcript_37441/m.115630 type:complete len:290 (-) Transcript_37441:972-1841(-)